jgi:ATP-dependent helicase/nuclease subunit A
MSEPVVAREPEDRAQRKRVIECTDECLCVEAGAGTGKTTLLIDRIMTLIIVDGARLRDIAAITFTEKAAGELKVKLYEKIDDRLAAGPGPEEETRLRRALADLEVCQVSTIHSFAGNLIRLRPVEAGVDPGFSVVDENEIGLITSEVWKRWLTARLGREDPVLELASGLDVTFDKLADLARRFYANRDMLMEKEAHEPDMSALEGLLSEAEATLSEALAELEGIARSLVPPGEASTRGDVMRGLAASVDKSVQGILELLGRWEEYERTRDRADLLSTLTAAASQKPTRSKNWPGSRDLLDRQKVLRDELKAAAERLIARLGELFAPAILARVLSFIEMVEEEKESFGVLDFQDLLLKARDMVRDNREARLYFQGQYSHILVDEFQDTDPLQAEIVFFLAEDGAEASEWDRVRLKPGKLFIVGDPKQSIYRFRRADIEIYDRARSVMGEAAAVPIWQNFRSVEGIVDWVNDAFECIMAAPRDGVYQAEYRRIGCSFEGTGQRAVTVAHNREFDKETAGDAREREAVFIARSIEELVRSGALVRGKDGAPRPVTFGDICVLYRIGTNVGLYERVLRERGIPFRTEGGKTFFGKQEVVDLRNAVCAIDNPFDEVAIVGALRSPFFAISDSELADFAARGGHFGYLEVGSGDGRVCRALALLADLHSRKDSRPMSATLEALLEATRAVELYTVADPSGQTLANLSKVVEWARDMEEKEAATFSRLAAWLSEMEGRAVQEGESPVEEAGGDFVRIMSVHKAKGLEFPVVFAAVMGQRPGPRDVRLVTRHSTGEAAFQVGKVRSAGFDELAEWDESSQEAEERRTFYVCATRARDRLVINDFAAKRTGMWFKDMLGEVRDLCADIEQPVDLCALETAEPTAPPPGRVTARAKNRLDEAEKEWRAGMERAREARSAGAVTRSATEAEGSPPPALETFWTGGPEEASGRDVGTALHRVMELVPAGASDGDVAALVRSVALEAGVRGQEEQLLKMALNVTSSDLWQRAMGARAVSREMPFTVKRGEEYLTGYVDLLFVEEDGAVIVDYKSDDVAASEVDRRLEFYHGQGEFYRDALEGSLGVAVKDVVFLFAAPGVARSLGSRG